jgi:hypothetical protein
MLVATVGDARAGVGGDGSSACAPNTRNRENMVRCEWGGVEAVNGTPRPHQSGQTSNNKWL